MSKKSFKGGLDSLLGESPTRSEIDIKMIGFENHLKEMERDRLIEGAKKKRGRPQTSTREITKSSQEGTKENETRATFIINEELLDKLKAIAYWERLLIKDVLNTALQEAVAKYEKKRGEIKPAPKN